MDRLRLATPEEVQAIKETSDLEGCQVVALTTQAGNPVAVIRAAVEVDPVYFPESFPDRLKAVFIRDIETHLAAKGVAAYYFNILATDEAWQKVSVNWGAVQVSEGPELRFKKVL